MTAGEKIEGIIILLAKFFLILGLILIFFGCATTPQVIQYTDGGNPHLNGVTTKIINQDQRAKHRLMVFDGYFSRPALIKHIGDRTEVLHKPIFNEYILVDEAFDSQRPGIVDLPPLVANHGYTMLVFSANPYMPNKIFEVTVIHFWTGRDDWSDCRSMILNWSGQKKICAGAIVYLPRVSPPLVTPRFGKTIDLGSMVWGGINWGAGLFKSPN